LYGTWATLDLANQDFEIKRHVLGIWLAAQLAPLVGPDAADLLPNLLKTPEQDTVTKFVEQAVSFRINQELGGRVEPSIAPRPDRKVSEETIALSETISETVAKRLLEKKIP
jgi:hypothetical protein